jgi:DNA-binding transcriptional LysR family regulator
LFTNVKIGHLQSFVTVAQLGSFTQAAKVLHISQPALTVQINQLEASLDDVRLLDRNTRSVRLTKVGKEVLPAALRIIEDMEKLVLNAKQISDEREIIVKIAAISFVAAAILPSAIISFNKGHPITRVQVTDAFSDRVFTLVRQEEVDFGIASLTEAPADIQTSVLFRDQLSAVFSLEPRLAQKSVVLLQDLLEVPLILMEPRTSNRRLVDRAFQSISRFVKPRYEANQITTAVAMAEAGLGVAVLPATLFRSRQNRRLHVKPIQHDMLCRDIGIVQKVGHSLPPDAAKFLMFLKSDRTFGERYVNHRPTRQGDPSFVG